MDVGNLVGSDQIEYKKTLILFYKVKIINVESEMIHIGDQMKETK